MKPALLVVLAALATSPIAAAQAAFTDSTLALRISPVDSGIAHDETVTTTLEIVYSYVTTGVAFAPTTVRVEIVDAPDWLVASVSPATLYFPVMAGTPAVGTSQAAPPRDARLFLALADGAPADALGIVSIQATAYPNGNIKGSTVTEQIPVRSLATTEPCVVVLDEAAAEPDETPTLETKTLGAEATLSTGPLLGSAALGAGLGLAVALRLRKRA